MGVKHTGSFQPETEGFLRRVFTGSEWTSGKFTSKHTTQLTNATNTGVSGITATGGQISDYTTPGGTVYRAHVFNTSGTFNVTAMNGSGELEYLVVGGGGGGTPGLAPDRCGAGGGAGGLRTNVSGHPLAGDPFTVPSSVPAPYTVTIGAGGGSPSAAPQNGASGGDSTLNLPSAITAAGGGGGGGAAAAGTGGGSGTGDNAAPVA